MLFQMSPEGLEAELAIKTTLVEALNAENEQLRSLLQKHADNAENQHNERYSALDARRESNIHDLQEVIGAMRTQLYDRVSAHDSTTSELAHFRQQALHLKAVNAEMGDELAALRTKVEILEEEHAEALHRYEEEKGKVVMLRSGLEESKRAIGIYQAQSDQRRNSVEHRRLSTDLSHSGLVRKATLNNTSSTVSEARRGSLNYLTGLGLAKQRVAYFDPRKPQPNNQNAERKDSSDSLVDPAQIPLPATPESGRVHLRRTSMPTAGYDGLPQGPLDGLGFNVPASASTPQFNTTSRRASLTAGRRASLTHDSPLARRRSSNLAHALMRLSGNDDDLPLSQSGEEHQAEQDNLTQLPDATPRRRQSNSAFERRRSSLQNNTPLARRGSDKPLPRLDGDSSMAPRTSLLSGPSTLPEDVESIGSYTFPSSVREESMLEEIEEKRSEIASPPLSRCVSDPSESIVHTLSLEAAMEIAMLKEKVTELTLSLMEAEESREASETIARALREFIAVSSSVDEAQPVKLPPAPSDSDDGDAEWEAEQQKMKEKEAKEKEAGAKRTSRWGMPKLIPSLSYTALAGKMVASAAAPTPAAITASSSSSSTIGFSKSPSVASLQPIAERDNASIKSGRSPSPSPSINFAQPEWRRNGALRNDSVASSVASGISSNPSSGSSPVLPQGKNAPIPPAFNSFNSFSFSAFQTRPAEDISCPNSPGGTTCDTPHEERDFDFGPASSAGSARGGSVSVASSETESEPPMTPQDASFGDVELPAKYRSEATAWSRSHSEDARIDPQTPRAPYAFAA